ncbi:hypothetical protein HYW17_03650 [Candidatus Uhrbacteria bacterium]|nr:hypothetical protein [Candidatus Uhrbacteria bacterium]
MGLVSAIQSGTGQRALKAASFLIYLTAIVLVLPGFISWVHRLIFIGYGLFILWVIRDKSANNKSGDADPEIIPGKNFWTALLIFSLLYLFLGRLYMFIRYGASPLGYDTGFYWQYFRLIIINGNIGTAVGSHLTYSSWFPLGFLGLPALTVIHLLHVFHQLLTAGALYFLLRSLPLRKYSFPISVLGVFLFALSINQFMAFWWMFYKQLLAIPFLLLAMGLFFRRSIIAIPVAGLAAAIHLSSAIPLGLALIIFITIQLLICVAKRHLPEKEFIYLILAGLLGSILFIALKGTADIHYYLTLFLKYKGLATNARSWEIEQIRGLFIPFTTFRLNALFYLPFALIGILQLRRFIETRLTERTLLIPITFAASLILVSFPFIHQTRSLIFFDLLLIILAAAPIFHFIKNFRRERHGTVLLGLLCFGFVAFTSRVIWNHEPQLYAAEAAELRVLERQGTAEDLRKIDDYVMVVSSLYTPWAYAFTGFGPTIVPGWLTWDKWDLKMWEEFWFKANNDRRLQLLQMYGDHVIYIFIGEHQLKQVNTPRLKEFIETDPHFTRFSPHIWKYTPHLQDTDSPTNL